ncbi:hypothetical protein AM352_04785 [Citrobacter koseri]|nr:hypothetical protein AM352_04785 [Citrobacter koseri]PWY10287.1 hypothetical protein DL345_11970 [Citrobacter koseri]BCL46313.1 hypothetical protein MPUCK001_01310 [Citrobacter koseri]
MPGDAVLTGHAMCSSRRPDKAFTPPSGIMSGGAATGLRCTVSSPARERVWVRGEAMRSLTPALSGKNINEG